MATMTAASLRSPIATVIAAAISSTTIIVLANCPAKSNHRDLVGSSSSSLGPSTV